MAAADSSSLNFLYKRLYAKGLDEDALMSGNNLLKWVKRDKKFASPQGKAIAAPYVNPQGIGATYATADANTQPRQGVQFLVTQAKMIGRVDISRDVLQNAENGGDEAQFINAFTSEVDGATEMFGQEINQRLYGSTLGERAKVHPTTAISTTQLTLANYQDAQFFEVGMFVSAADPAGAQRNAGSTVRIVAVDPATGVLTANQNWSTITGITNGDSLIRASFWTASLAGLAGWVPTSVTPGESFFGVDRSPYRTRLAGVYFDASTFSIRQGFLKSFGFARQQIGGKFDQKAPIFVHPDNFIQIVQSVEAVRILDLKLETSYNVGIEAVEVLGNTIVQDRHCPLNQAYMVPKGAFTFASAGDPKIEDAAGSGRFVFEPATGLLKGTIVLLGNGYSEAPNTLMRLQLPTPV